MGRSSSVKRAIDKHPAPITVVALVVLFAGLVAWFTYGGGPKATVRFTNSTSATVSISECLAYNDEVHLSAGSSVADVVWSHRPYVYCLVRSNNNGGPYLGCLRISIAGASPYTADAGSTLAGVTRKRCEQLRT